MTSIGATGDVNHDIHVGNKIRYSPNIVFTHRCWPNLEYLENNRIAEPLF